MKVEFNINNYVEFDLTEYGAKILNDRDEFYATEHPNVAFFQNKPKHVEGQTMKMQLWDVMATFGEYTVLGLEAFCNSATIVLNIEEGEIK